jgi:hypothetical protein
MFDELIDRVAGELEEARSKSGGLRGEQRHALITRLERLDEALAERARAALDEPGRAALAREADEDLAGYRATMPPDALIRAREAAIDRLLRERLGLPTIRY